MAIQIDDIRVSFLWAETVVDHFAESEPGFLGRDYAYEDRFGKIQHGVDDGLRLTMPWPKPKGQMFWTYYLEGKSLGTLSPRRAWKSLVPLRRAPAYRIQAPWFGGKLRVAPEVFVYPHGQVFVITFTCMAPLGLDAAVQTSHRFRTQALDLINPDNTVVQARVDKIAQRILAQSRTELFGENAVPARTATTPFSVVTIVRGAGVDPGKPLDPASPVRRALDGWTSWRDSYKTDPLPPLHEARFPAHRSSAGHVFYGSKRGRAIWFPGLFTLEKPSRRTLGCYHRNQVFAGMQVESLGELTREVAGRIGEGRKPKGTLRDCSRRAAGALGRLFGGNDQNTYRSWSPRAQIEVNFLAGVNELRKELDMPELTV